MWPSPAKYAWTVHSNQTPALGRSSEACADAGPILDPTRAGPEHVGEEAYADACTLEKVSACMLGDLTRLLGPLKTNPLGHVRYAHSFRGDLQNATSLQGGASLVLERWPPAPGNHTVCAPLRPIRVSDLLSYEVPSLPTLPNATEIPEPVERISRQSEAERQRQAEINQVVRGIHGSKGGGASTSKAPPGEDEHDGGGGSTEAKDTPLPPTDVPILP